MSSIEINKTNVQVQMNLADNQLTSLEDIQDCIRDVAGELITEWIKDQQARRLTELLGARWQPLAEEQIGIGCPRCGSVHLRRKAWRTRTLKLAMFGPVEVPRRQLACQDCGRAWMPFEAAMKLPSGSHGPKCITQALARLMEMSYQKAAESDPGGPSAAKLHRLVGRCPRPDLSGEADTVVVDATDVPLWQEAGQISLSVAHQIAPADPHRDAKTRPPLRERQLIGVAGGAEADIKSTLQAVDIKAIVHDGKLDLKPIAVHEGRCRWHIPYTVRYLLYEDDIKADDNNTRVQNLRERMWSYPAENHLRKWLAANREAEAACRHVRASLPALREMTAHPDAFSVQTTSHLEREMVEINKRFENGGGWTAEGAENLLWLHQLNRFEPNQFNNSLQKLIEQTMVLN